MTKQTTFDVYYDETGDFLELAFGEPVPDEQAEEIEPGVFVSRAADGTAVASVGILGFKKRAAILKRVLRQLNLRMPLEIGVAPAN